MTNVTEQLLLIRAVDAYFDAVAHPLRLNMRYDQPDTRLSGVVEHGGEVYVHLCNAYGLSAVFRVRDDGQLERLRRWPAAVTSSLPKG